MQQLIDDVRAFMKAAEQEPEPGPPRLLDKETRELRVDILLEELREYLKATAEDDLEGIADGLADMVYVIVGTAIAHRIPLDHVWREVQRSNMDKVNEAGKISRSESGKILKPSGWRGPDISGVLEEAARLHGAG